MSATGYVLALFLSAAPAAAQDAARGAEELTMPQNHVQELTLHRALLSLPIAAALAAVLAFRPRRRHAPPRRPEVVQTQIMLAIVGALVMLVVGASLARAFGIAGAASLVRYRAKVEDAKDASVMLSALGIGLASGVGLFWLAAAGTLFIVAVLFALEGLEPRRTVVFELNVKAAGELRPRIDQLLKRHRLEHHVRSSAADEFSYEVEVPLGHRLEPVSEAILAIDPKKPPAIEWKEKDA